MIVKILKEYEDGRSDILTAGQSAFRLIRTHDEKPYLEADVEYLEEDFTEVDAAVSARLEELCNQCHQILYGEDAPRFETEGGISLAYHVASELPVDVAIRQSLLEIRSEAVRQGQTRRAPCGMVPATAKAGARARKSGGQRPRQAVGRADLRSDRIKELFRMSHHSGRIEKSLFLFLNRNRRGIPRSLGMTKWWTDFFLSQFRLRGFVLARTKTHRLKPALPCA